MKRKISTRKNLRESGSKKHVGESNTIAYRLKCTKTANGLSHYVMYGDVDRKEALL